MPDPYWQDSDGLTLGARVKHIRVSRGWSLRKYAQVAGVNFNTLNRFEDGGVVKSSALLSILAEAGIVISECDHRWQTRCVRCGAVRAV